jgi:hypothetical protein
LLDALRAGLSSLSLEQVNSLSLEQVNALVESVIAERRSKLKNNE